MSYLPRGEEYWIRSRVWSELEANHHKNNLQKILTNTPYRLLLNPAVPGKSKNKIMRFGPNGQILEGRNNNETTWRIRQGLLELLVAKATFTASSTTVLTINASFIRTIRILDQFGSTVFGTNT